MVFLTKRLPLSRGLINHIKALEAERFRPTYSLILDRIAAGPLVHADETKVSVGGKDGYVWVFTSLEDVAFIYTETREGSTLQQVLGKFRGVLVSDFYAAYDAIECAQQKCLIHLMRDVNDDLSKQPFNEEMKEIARRFASLLKPIVETVDHFGLKARYLRRHKRSVENFTMRFPNRPSRRKWLSGTRSDSRRIEISCSRSSITTEFRGTTIMPSTQLRLS
jgi:Transposase IS66 family